MGKRGGFPGGMPGGMGNLMKQAQKMQKQLEQAREELDNKEYTASVGGGNVTAVVNGKNELISIKLQEDVVDKDDIEMLEDLIVAAINEANRQAQQDKESKMQGLTGGLGGLGGLPF